MPILHLLNAVGIWHSQYISIHTYKCLKQSLISSLMFPIVIFWNFFQSLTDMQMTNPRARKNLGCYCPYGQAPCWAAVITPLSVTPSPGNFFTLPFSSLLGSGPCTAISIMSHVVSDVPCLERHQNGIRIKLAYAIDRLWLHIFIDQF